MSKRGNQRERNLKGEYSLLHPRPEGENRIKVSPSVQGKEKNFIRIAWENIFALGFRGWQDIYNRKSCRAIYLICFQMYPMVSLTSRLMLSGITTFLSNLSLGGFIEEHMYLSGCMVCPKYWSQLWFSVWGERMTQLFRKNNYVNRSKRANGQNMLMN